MSCKYWFSSGGFIDIQGISINPNISAKVQALCFYNGGVVQMKFVDIVDKDYTDWGNDDDYLISLVGHKLGFGERVETNDPNYTPKPFKTYNFTSNEVIPTTIIDNRSVHNEADIQKIQTMQEQIDAQASKLKTITDMLIGKGLV
jgi:hypothetical protein